MKAFSTWFDPRFMGKILACVPALFLFAGPECPLSHAATLDVGPSGYPYTTIQSAVNAAGPGDLVYVHNGSYFENVTVDRAIRVVGEGRPYTGGDMDVPDIVVNSIDSDVPVFTVTADGVEITGFCVLYATEASAISLLEVNHCLIRDIYTCPDLPGSFAYNQNGIFLYGSSQNTIKNNWLWHVENDGIKLSSSNSNVLENNFSRYCGDQGIELDTSSSNIIQSGYIYDCNVGVYMNNSHNNVLEDIGIVEPSVSGMSLQQCQGNVIRLNHIYYAPYNGIYLLQSDWNKLHKNLMNSGMESGIFLHYSDWNQVVENTISSNTNGIRIGESTYNRMYLNTLKDNTNNVNSSGSVNDWVSPIRIWYGYETNIPFQISLMGNYYSDHDHKDTPSGYWPADGITDADYDLPGSEPDDYYPLAKENIYYYGDIFCPSVWTFSEDVSTLVLESLTIGNHASLGSGSVILEAGTLFIGGR